MSEWISVKDKLPETKHGTWSKDDYLVINLYSYNIGRTRDGVWVDMDNNYIDDVTHWMQLPEPPE